MFDPFNENGFDFISKLMKRYFDFKHEEGGAFRVTSIDMTAQITTINPNVFEPGTRRGPQQETSGYSDSDENM